jgi:hypothetical protein
MQAHEHSVIAPERRQIETLGVSGPIAGRRASFTYVAAALIAASVLTLPVAGYPMPVGGEFGYQAAMIVALREHLQWGSQVVWAYGPYGYLNEPAFMDFNSWLLAFVANLAGHAAFFVVLALFLLRIRAKSWLVVLVSLVILLSFDRYQGREFERFAVLDHKAALVATLLLYLAIDTSREKVAAVFASAAGLLIAYLFLDKGTYILAGGALVPLYLLLSLTRRRAASPVALVGSLIAGYLGLWILAGQSILAIPNYFRSMFEMIAGYTPAMSLVDESMALNATLQIELAGAMLAVTGLSLVITLWRHDWSLFHLLLLISPLLFVVYKNSVVRFDEGRVLAFWALVAVLQSLVLARAISPSGAIKRSVPAVGAAVTVLVCIVLVGGLGPYLGGYPDRVRSLVPMQPTFAFPDNLVSYRHTASLLIQPDDRLKEQAAVIESMRAAYSLPPDLVAELRQGTVDAVPFEIQTVFAHDFRWNPQPVLHSYGAYRPYLDHLDSLHYMGPDAPRFVLFTAWAIDLRYPLFDEPETYRVLIEKYTVRQRISDLLILERRPDGPLPPERQVGSVTDRIGDWIAVPPHGNQRLYGRVQVRYSLLGQCLILLDRPPELHVRLKYGGGQVSPAYRFVAANGPDGLELSGFAPDTANVEGLLEGHFDQPIEAIQILADPPQGAYQQQVEISYFTQPAT